MKTTRLLLASLLGASLAAFALAGPGPQYWTQSAKNQQAQQVKIATETKTVADAKVATDAKAAPNATVAADCQACANHCCDGMKKS